MSWLFRKRLKPEKILDKQKKTLNKAVREVDREKKRLEMDEVKLITEIKKAAVEGQTETAKILARDLVRARHFARKFALLKANVQTISIKAQTNKCQHTMARATRERQMNLPLVAKILREFSKQSDLMDLKDDVICAAVDGDDDEDESDAVILKVLDELGLNLSDQLSGLPHAVSSTCQRQLTNSTLSQPQEVKKVDIDADIQARLDKLRRN